MERFGASAQIMQPMDEDQIFIARLNLLIVMAKAFLKGYPLGSFRQRALQENAQFVFYEALSRTGRIGNSAPASRDDSDRNHLFLQRAQLLAVMCKSIVEGNPMGEFRLRAMRDNVDQLCHSLADNVSMADVQFLKVA